MSSCDVCCRHDPAEIEQVCHSYADAPSNTSRVQDDIALTCMTALFVHRWMPQTCCRRVSGERNTKRELLELRSCCFAASDFPGLLGPDAADVSDQKHGRCVNTDAQRDRQQHMAARSAQGTPSHGVLGGAAAGQRKGGAHGRGRPPGKRKGAGNGAEQQGLGKQKFRKLSAQGKRAQR